MGVLKRFEQRLEGLVNGTFAKVFKSEVQPVEIAGALQRECDNNATIWNRDRTVVPNDFIVELSTPDFERLSPYSGQLGDELAGMVRDYAKQQRYTFMGPIKVHLEKADDLDTGLYRVRSRTLASVQHQRPGAAGRRGRQRSAAGRPPPSRRPARLRLPAEPPRTAAPPPPGARPGGPGYPPRRGRAARPARHAAARPGSAPAARTRHWIEINGTRHQISRAHAACWAAAPRPTCGSTTPAYRAGTARSGPERPRRSRISGSTNGIVVDGQHTTRATLRDGSRIVVGSTTIIYRQAEG